MAWFRFRATFRRRLGGYLVLAVLIGLVGGVAMASMVAARRTDASYPKFLASTNPSDLIIQPNGGGTGATAAPSIGPTSAFSPSWPGFRMCRRSGAAGISPRPP